MPGPARDFRGHPQPTRKVAVVLSVALYSRVEMFRRENQRNLDNRAHALRDLVGKGLHAAGRLRHLDPGNYKNTVLDGSKTRTVYPTVSEDLYNQVDRFWRSKDGIEDWSSGFRLLLQLGLGS